MCMIRGSKLIDMWEQNTIDGGIDQCADVSKRAFKPQDDILNNYRDRN